MISIQAMPFEYFWDLNESLDVGILIGTYTYPFGLSFLLPIFVLTLVKEKEDRIQIMFVHHLRFD